MVIYKFTWLSAFSYFFFYHLPLRRVSFRFVFWAARSLLGGCRPHTQKNKTENILFIYAHLASTNTGTHTHRHAQTCTDTHTAMASSCFLGLGIRGREKKELCVPHKNWGTQKKKYRKNWIHLGVFLFKGQLPLSCAQVGATRSTENACHCHWSLLLQNGEYATATAALQLIN